MHDEASHYGSQGLILHDLARLQAVSFANSVGFKVVKVVTDEISYSMSLSIGGRKNNKFAAGSEIKWKPIKRLLSQRTGKLTRWLLLGKESKAVVRLGVDGN